MLTAQPLSPQEQLDVAEWLAPEEAPLFWSQQVADQRHGLETARKLAEQRPNDRELIRAGLLHDVGKAQSGLGPVGRTVATVATALRMPLTDRQRRYRDHGPLGAAALRAAGADGLVTSFAELHPGAAPGGTDQERWQLLLRADDD